MLIMVFAACFISCGGDGGGGNGGATSTGYDVIMQNDGNGTVTANPNHAEQGMTVTVGATPGNGFKFNQWQVISGGASLSPNTTTSPATFTMPDNAVTIKALFEALPPNTPYLSLSFVSFANAESGYAQPAAKPVTINNTGTGTATVTGISIGGDNPGSFTLGGDLTPVIAAGTTADFTVRPNAGLSVGTYNAVITVTYNGGETAFTSVSFTVMSLPTNAGLYLKTATTYEFINTVPVNNVDAAITYVNNTPSTYILLLNDDVPIAGSTARALNTSDAKLTIIGIGAERTVSLTSEGRFITVGASGQSGIELTIGNNITLKGRSGNNESVVRVQNDGVFIMRGSAKITGNTYSGNGGGVSVDTGGTLTMSDNATVTGNTTGGHGGGVYVHSGSVTMQDNASVNDNNTSGGDGGGMHVNNSSFTMSGNATVTGNTTGGYGGGVFVVWAGSTFIMKDNASVSGNKANSGGGVFVVLGASLIMNGSTSVSGNTSNNSGGGVYLSESSSFTMSGSASVRGNTSAYSGGGVYLGPGSNTFTMSGGTVYGNSAGGNSNTVTTIGYDGAALIVSGASAAKYGNGKDIGEDMLGSGTTAPYSINDTITGIPAP